MDKKWIALFFLVILVNTQNTVFPVNSENEYIFPSWLRKGISYDYYITGGGTVFSEGQPQLLPTRSIVHVDILDTNPNTGNVIFKQTNPSGYGSETYTWQLNRLYLFCPQITLQDYSLVSTNMEIRVKAGTFYSNKYEIYSKFTISSLLN